MSIAHVDKSRVSRDEIDLDGFIDDRGIQYIGKASRHADGTWTCLANVANALCRVQVKITPVEISTDVKED